MTTPTRKAAFLHSIRWRLTLWMSVLLLASAGVGLAIVYRETSAQLSGEIDRDLHNDTLQFAQSLRLTENDELRSAQLAARRYLDAQPFRSNSTLLFLLDPGHPPISNYSEVFRPSRRDEGETSAEQGAENRLTAAISRPQFGYHDQRVTDVGRVRTLEVAVRIGTQRTVIGAGEPLAPLAQAQRGIVHSFIVAVAVLVIAVLAGANLIATGITAQLRRMARVATRIDAGDISSRIDVPDGSSETGILATSFNHMLERIERGMRLQREFVADASHELRTPLTVIQGQMEVLANRPEVDHAELLRVSRLVRAETSRMRRMVDELLLLAQAERPDFLQIDEINLTPFLEDIWDGATLVADRRFELSALPRGTLAADPDRLAQALRNLINNAVSHTAIGTGTVSLSAVAAPNRSVRIRISDDGPGIPSDEFDRIFNRFHRIDGSQTTAEVPGGSGLGLSIVRAIVEAHGGTVAAANRPDGSGAAFDVVLPRFTAAG